MIAVTPLRPRQREAEADRRAVVEHVDGVARESDRVGEVPDDLGEIVEACIGIVAAGAS